MPRKNKVVKEPWEIGMDAIDEYIEKLDLGLEAIYSAYKDDENGVPVNNLNERAIEGRVRIFNDVGTFWGGPKARAFRSRILRNPTWLTLYKYSDKLIKETGDRHHAFFEGFSILHKEGDITVIELDMGS